MMEAHLPDGTVLQFPDGTAPDVVQTAAKRVLAGEIGLEERLDKRSGAPVAVRAKVGAAVRPEDRLATLQQTYPDAKPYGDDNFVFADPKTGRPTLYNEQNTRVFGVPMPTLGDIASVGPEIAETIGGIAGGAAGVMAAPVTGGASIATVPAATGLGAAAGRELYGLLSGPLLGTQDTRGLPERLSDTAMTTGVNAVAGPAADLLMKGIRTATGPVTRYIGGALRDANVGAAFERLGIPGMAGAATGNKAIQTIEAGLANTPGGAGVMQGAADRTVSATGDVAADMARRFANGGPVLSVEGAGRAIKDATKNAGERFKVTRQQLDDDAVALIGADRPTAMTQTQALVADLQARLARAPNSQPELQRAITEAQSLLTDAAANGDALPFDVVRKIRTRIGSELERPDLSGYRPGEDQHMARLYGALKDDLYGAARAAGPDAEKKMQLHDRYVRFMRNDANGRVPPLETLQKIVDQKTDAQALTYALQGAKDGSQRLAQLRASFKPEEWDTVSATVFDRLGRAVPSQQSASMLGEEAGDFSVNTFLTNWNKLQQNGSAKVLFGGTRYRDLQQPMNDLVKVVGSLKDAQKMANPSGTARSVGVQTLITALGGATGAAVGGDTESAGGTALGAAAALTGGGYGAAKLLTSPRFVRWLSTSARVVYNNPNALSAQIARLVGVAKAEPDLRDAIGQYAQQIQQIQGSD